MYCVSIVDRLSHNPIQMWFDRGRLILSRWWWLEVLATFFSMNCSEDESSLDFSRFSLIGHVLKFGPIRSRAFRVMRFTFMECALPQIFSAPATKLCVRCFWGARMVRTSLLFLAVFDPNGRRYNWSGRNLAWYSTPLVHSFIPNLTLIGELAWVQEPHKVENLVINRGFGRSLSVFRPGRTTIYVDQGKISRPFLPTPFFFFPFPSLPFPLFPFRPSRFPLPFTPFYSLPFYIHFPSRLFSFLSYPLLFPPLHFPSLHLLFYFSPLPFFLSILFFAPSLPYLFSSLSITSLPFSFSIGA